MGHRTCKTTESAKHLIENKEKNRSSRVEALSTYINLSHPAAPWLVTQTCVNNIFNLPQNNNAIYLFENDNEIELRMGHNSSFSIEMIDKINKENIKEIRLKNNTAYISLPDPTILVTTTSAPERQSSISVLDDDNKENLPTDIVPCSTISIPDEYTKAIGLLNIR